MASNLGFSTEHPSSSLWYHQLRNEHKFLEKRLVTSEALIGTLQTTVNQLQEQLSLTSTTVHGHDIVLEEFQGRVSNELDSLNNMTTHVVEQATRVVEDYLQEHQYPTRQDFDYLQAKVVRVHRAADRHRADAQDDASRQQYLNQKTHATATLLVKKIDKMEAEMDHKLRAQQILIEKRSASDIAASSAAVDLDRVDRSADKLNKSEIDLTANNFTSNSESAGPANEKSASKVDKIPVPRAVEMAAVEMAAIEIAKTGAPRFVFRQKDDQSPGEYLHDVMTKHIRLPRRFEADCIDACRLGLASPVLQRHLEQTLQRDGWIWMTVIKWRKNLDYDSIARRAELLKASHEAVSDDARVGSASNSTEKEEATPKERNVAEVSGTQKSRNKKSKKKGKRHIEVAPENALRE